MITSFPILQKNNLYLATDVIAMTLPDSFTAEANYIYGWFIYMCRKNDTPAFLRSFLPIPLLWLFTCRGCNSRASSDHVNPSVHKYICQYVRSEHNRSRLQAAGRGSLRLALSIEHSLKKTDCRYLSFQSSLCIFLCFCACCLHCCCFGGTFFSV